MELFFYYIYFLTKSINIMSKKLFFFLLVPFLGFSQVQIGQDIDGEAAGD